jgi:hypothetical protein
LTLSDISAAGKTKLSQAVELGARSLQKIAKLLYEFGYINDVEKWLRKNP